MTDAISSAREVSDRPAMAGAARLGLAARAFVARRGAGRTIIAGYPWFLDWGRDSFISARGLLAAGMVSEVAELLVTFGRFSENGTMPNTIQGGNASNRDTSDAPLWFGVVCEETAALMSEKLYDTPVDQTGRNVAAVLREIAVGYAGGYTPNPTYEEVCSGRTGHAEVVLVAFDSTATSFEEMLRLFWEGHDPTHGMRQGNDVGTQYRSMILCADESQQRAAEASRDAYQRVLTAGGHGEITTEILLADATRPFYYAEDYHQQYLEKNPGGYCGLGGTGVACPVGLVKAS